MSPKQKKTSCEAPIYYSSLAVPVNASALQETGPTEQRTRPWSWGDREHPPHRNTPTARSAQTRAGGEELAPGAARPRRLGGPTLEYGPPHLLLSPLLCASNLGPVTFLGCRLRRLTGDLLNGTQVLKERPTRIAAPA